MIYFPVHPKNNIPAPTLVRGPAQVKMTPPPIPLAVKPKAPPAELNPIVPEQKVEVPSLPTMTQMAKNVMGSLMKTAKGAIRGQGVRVETNEAERRLLICRTCNFFRQHDQRCSKCGCYMAVKTYLRAERCPVGKW